MAMKLHPLSTPYTLREYKLWLRIKPLKQEIERLTSESNSKDKEIENLKAFILGL